MQDTQLMLDLIRVQRGLLDRMITHTFALAAVQKAFDLQSKAECGKIILLPWRDGNE
jgi:hypothetical protein